jgi:GNAT superfamily N-acetyltransferase
LTEGKASDSLSPITKLASAHETDRFDCGKEELNRFLKRYALVNQQANNAQTYVVTHGLTVVGYYSLTVGGVEPETAPPRASKGMPRYPIPVMILARLAIDISAQGRGIGKGLLKDALRRTAAAADIAGIRALFVNAKDDEARRFYAYYDFDPSPADSHQMFLVMKDLKRLA